MLVKSICASLFGFIFIQVMNFAMSQDVSVSTTPAGADIEYWLCHIPGEIEPFLPRGANLVDAMNHQINDAATLNDQLDKSCNDIKDGSSTDESKLWMSERLKNFALNGTHILSEMAWIVENGNPILDEIFELAKNLRTSAEE
ncbi:uncharacterized protein [Periplaneta americana]|uniref:uncharacterized protein n=1 Tax=Periplaneta americana TaxID=6978 RepID=UPI0037E77AB0